MSMDVHATGRVKLSEFYAKGWQFREASEYLRQLGALDESSPSQGPQVIIPNYLTGMANCLTSTPYYSICCLNECDNVFQHLEGSISSSRASTADIISALESMPDTISLEAVKVSESLRSRLEEVAAVHNGKIPLHGRLFAQWLHFAFPRDCPFPHLAGTVNPQTPMKYDQALGRIDASSVSDEEMAQFINSDAARVDPSPEAGATMWIMKEHLLESSTPSDHSVRNFLRGLSGLGLLAALISLIFKQLLPLVSISCGGGKTMKYCQYDV